MWDWNTESFVEITSAMDELNIIEIGSRAIVVMEYQNLGVSDWQLRHPGGGNY